jgi:hypothetical protein
MLPWLCMAVAQLAGLQKPKCVVMIADLVCLHDIED